VAKEVTRIFGELYRAKYPIRRMRLVSDYGGSDWKSIEADNTSAFNCRPATGSKKWSRHAFGKAIDLNPLENPYISRSGRIAHKASLKFRARKRHSPFTAEYRAVLLPGDPAVKAFKKRGWRWGGEWHTIKDYQHFDKR
jgi:poly-gamma-glutamate synthesis protein (capsule biosynthesis protein)